MRIDERTRPAIQYYTVYIADDGTEFNTRLECELYEYRMSLKEKYIPSHTVESIEEDPATIWCIKDEEDFKWLQKVGWAHCDVKGKFTLPGWYIARFHDGGDHRDYYTVEYVEDYVSRYQKILDDIKIYLV